MIIHNDSKLLDGMQQLRYQLMCLTCLICLSPYYHEATPYAMIAQNGVKIKQNFVVLKY